MMILKYLLSGNKKLYIFAFFAFLITLISRIFFNGLIYGLDYGIYQPDGIYYSVKTLQILGLDFENALKIVQTWYEDKAKITNLQNSVFYNLNSSIWEVTEYRILYPLMSSIFVYFMGFSGMLVVPAISCLVVFFCIVKLCTIYNVKSLGYIIILLLSASLTFQRWFFVNYTDSLLTAILSLTVLILTKTRLSITNNLCIILLVFFSSFTRFCLPIWIGISIVLFLSKYKKYSLIVLISSVLFSMPTLLSTPSNALLPNLYSTPMLDKIVLFPFYFLRGIAVEFIQLLALDRILLYLLIIAIYLASLNFKFVPSQYFIVTLISTFIFTGINGVIGVNFRYQLPIIPFIAWILCYALHKFKENDLVFLIKRRL